jgi:hypothetical protein
MSEPLNRCATCNAPVLGVERECDALLTCAEYREWEGLSARVSHAHDEIAQVQREQAKRLGPLVAKALQTWKWELHTGYDSYSFEPVDRELGRLLGDLLVELPRRRWGKDGSVTRLRDVVVIDTKGVAVSVEIEFAERGVLLTPRGTEPIDEIAHRLSVEFDLDAFIEQKKQERLKSIDDEIAYLQKQREDVVAGKKARSES